MPVQQQTDSPADDRPRHQPPPLRLPLHRARVRSVQRGRPRARVRAPAAPRAALAERGAAQEAEDYDARPPRPHPVRARGPGLRLPPAGLPQGRHRQDVRDAAAAAGAAPAGVARHRPGRRRPAVGLRDGEHLPLARVRHGESPYATTYASKHLSTKAAALCASSA